MDLAAFNSRSPTEQVWYSGLNVGLNKRFSNRYQGQVSYTLSKATQLGANAHYYTPSQAVGGIDKGPTLNDMRNKLSVTGTVTLPLGRAGEHHRDLQRRTAV